MSAGKQKLHFLKLTLWLFSNCLYSAVNCFCNLKHFKCCGNDHNLAVCSLRKLKQFNYNLYVYMICTFILFIVTMHIYTHGNFLQKSIRFWAQACPSCFVTEDLQHPKLFHCCYLSSCQVFFLHNVCHFNGLFSVSRFHFLLIGFSLSN